MPADYGIVSTVGAITGVLAVVYQMGQLGSWQRFYYDYRDDPKELKEYLGTIIVFIFSFSLGCTILLSTVGKSLFSLVAKDVPFVPYMQIALWMLFLSPFFAFWLRLFQVRERSQIYSAFSVIRFLVATFLTLYFVVVLRQGALGQIKGRFYAALIFFIVALFGLRKEISLRVSFTKLKASLKYGVPLVPHTLAGWIMSLADRLFLNHYRDISRVGIYGIGYNFGSIMGMITTAINYAYIPFFMSTAKERGNEAKGIFSGLATYYIMGVLLIATCLSIFSKEVITVMTVKSYYDAHKVVPVVCFSFVANGMYYLVVNPIVYVKTAVKYLPIATLSSAAINMILNYLLIPKHGQMGAAYATLMSYVVSFLLTWFISYKVYPIRFEYKRILLIFLAISPTLTSGLLLSRTNLRFRQTIPAKSGLILVYPMLLLLFGVLRRSEIDALVNRFAGKLRRK